MSGKINDIKGIAISIFIMFVSLEVKLLPTYLQLKNSLVFDLISYLIIILAIPGFFIYLSRLVKLQPVKDFGFAAINLYICYLLQFKLLANHTEMSVLLTMIAKICIFLLFTIAIYTIFLTISKLLQD